MIEYDCPICGFEMQSPDSLAMKREKCPRCMTSVLVPEGKKEFYFRSSGKEKTIVIENDRVLIRSTKAGFFGPKSIETIILRDKIKIIVINRPPSGISPDNVGFLYLPTDRKLTASAAADPRMMAKILDHPHTVTVANEAEFSLLKTVFATLKDSTASCSPATSPAKTTSKGTANRPAPPMPISSEDWLGKAAQAGHAAKEAVQEKRFDDAWRHYHEQKNHYMNHANRSGFSLRDILSLDSSVHENMANILGLEGKHIEAFTHIVYWVIAQSDRPIERHWKKLTAYYNRCKFKTVLMLEVAAYAESDIPVPDLVTARKKVAEWVRRENAASRPSEPATRCDTRETAPFDDDSSLELTPKEYYLEGRASEKAAKVAVKERRLEDAMQLYRRQKMCWENYAKLQTEQPLTLFQIAEMDAAPHEGIANVYRLKREHDKALANYLYYYSTCSLTGHSPDDNKLAAYFGRCKFTHVTMSNVMWFLESRVALFEFGKLESKVSEWTARENGN